MDIQPNGKVLILGQDTRSFLSVIRSLGRKHLQVHVGWCSDESEAASSKYVSQIHELPSYSPDNEQWKQSLIRIMNQERFDLVIPCNDQTLIPLQLHRADLEKHGRIYLLNAQAFSVVFDKFKTNELARSLDIPVPKEQLITKTNNIENVSSTFSWPVVLKPRRSYSLQNLSRRNSVRKANNTEELTAHLENLLPYEDVLIQENCNGIGVGVEVLAQHGNVLVAFQHARVHEPLSGGGSSYRKSVPLDPALFDAATKLMKALDYSGVAMIEFKVDAETDRWVLMEINGRFWGSLPLAVACEVNFPYYLYSLLVLGERVFPKDYKTGVYCRNLQRDLVWIFKNIKGRIRSPHAENTLPLWHVAKEFKTFLTFREHNDTLVWDDLTPGVLEFKKMIVQVTKRIQNKVHAGVLSSWPVQKGYRHMALPNLKKAQAIVFVCRGNICRSPFAEQYARQLFSRSIQVTSCGYHPKVGRTSPKEAMIAAQEYGIDLSSHRSIVISEEIVQKAQIILAFDELNRRTLIEMFPHANGKILLLGFLSKKSPPYIRDPYGGTLTDFKAIYQSIALAIQDVKIALNRPG